MLNESHSMKIKPVLIMPLTQMGAARLLNALSTLTRELPVKGKEAGSHLRLMQGHLLLVAFFTVTETR